MKVLVDSGPLNNAHSVRGIGVNTKGLLFGLKKSRSEGVEIIEGDAGTEDLSQFDAVHFTSFKPFFISVPWKKPSKTKFVLTIHDLIQLVYPSIYRPGIKGSIRFLINKYLIKKNVDAIITISETSKKDICRFLDIDPNIVHVIYLAPAVREKKSNLSREEIIEKYKLPKKFALYVGDVNYNKNIPTLVSGCKKSNLDLVMVGKQAGNIHEQDLNHPELNHLKNINWQGVYRLGYVPDEELNEIYKIASVCIQPSLYEGFGLPILEAFNSDCPVIASKTQVLVEIANGGAEFFDPKSPEDLSKKIKIILGSQKLRDQMVNMGRQIVKNFNWEKVGRETKLVYKNL